MLSGFPFISSASVFTSPSVKVAASFELLAVSVTVTPDTLLSPLPLLFISPSSSLTFTARVEPFVYRLRLSLFVMMLLRIS